MSWSARRQFSIVIIVILAIIVPAAYLAFDVFYEPPNCFDGRKNGGEEGVDCGGSCALLCRRQAFEPIVLWQRFFETNNDTNIYNVIAYVENVNIDAGARNAEYAFRLYDSQNNLIKEEKGVTRMMPKSVIPVVKNGINTNGIDVSRISFEFTNEVVWQKEESIQSIIAISNERMINVSTVPRINATLQNVILSPIRGIDVIAIVYDSDDNAIGVSSTFIDVIEKDGSRDITFTWPRPFERNPIRFEIIPLYEIPN